MTEDRHRLKLRVALARLSAAVLEDLARREGAPTIGPMQDLRHWRRYTQTSFVALRQDAWHMPKYVSTVGWLDTFPEMADVRHVIDADPVLRTRVDASVGPAFSRQCRRLNWLLVEHLIEPMVLAVRAYRYEDTGFDGAYRRLAAGLVADNVRMVEFVPLNAFISPFEKVTLADGLILQQMTDRQMSAAIRVQGVPGEFGGGPNAFEVSWLNQWALTAERSVPLHTDRPDQPDRPAAAPFPALIEPMDRLVQALRIVCGGSVIATRPIYAQHDDDFPIGLSESALLTPVGVVDLDRPTYLNSEVEVNDVREVYQLLGEPAVRNNRVLQTALRRLVASGSRNIVQDRLVDLMTSAEALFVKRAGITGNDKGRHIADGASTLLEQDPVLTAGSEAIYELMRLAYRLRNDEIHGDDPTERPLALLDGSVAGGLGAVVTDIERVMMRAIHLVLRDVVSAGVNT